MCYFNIIYLEKPNYFPLWHFPEPLKEDICALEGVNPLIFSAVSAVERQQI